MDKKYAILVIFIIFVVVSNKKGSKKNLMISQKKIKPILNTDLDEEDVYFISYINDKTAPESSAHRNRIFVCDDHSSVRKICEKANSSNLCQAHEIYAFSFCRKSCGYCHEFTNYAKSSWRLVPISSFKPTLPISEIKAYSSYSADSVETEIFKTFASSSYAGFDPYMAFDNNTETYWIPEKWGYHERESDFIGAVFSTPAKINAIKLKFKKMDGVELPKGFHVESASAINDKFYRRWTIFLHKGDPNGVYVKPSCPSLYRTYATSTSIRCYRIIWQNVSWFEAEKECQNRSAALLSIHGKQDLDFIRLEPFTKAPFWSGLNSVYTNNSFHWSDGTPNDYIKLTGNDNEESSDEKCVYIDENNVFKKSNCNEKKVFICTKPSQPFDFGGDSKSEKKVTDPKIKFSSKDYYTPVLISSENEEFDPSNTPIDWPEYARIPVLSDTNTTYSERIQKLQPKLLENLEKANNNMIVMNETDNEASEEKK